MSWETLCTREVIIPVAVFSIIWFIIGVLAGQALPKKKRSKGGKRAQPPKPGRGGGGKTEIFVGNLPYSVKEDELRSVFKKFGSVRSVRLIENRFTGKSRGYGFVEMADRGEADKAIKALNGNDFKGRKLIVNEAKNRSRKD